jgi:hypothetical protein
MREVKKLSKQRENAADHAQMKQTSRRVCASLADVCHNPMGRPKYSRYIATITWTKVRGENIITKVGELPTIPMIPFCDSMARILMATARAAVVNVILMNLKSNGTYIFVRMKALKRFFLDLPELDLSPDSLSERSPVILGCE